MCVNAFDLIRSKENMKNAICLATAAAFEILFNMHILPFQYISALKSVMI